MTIPVRLCHFLIHEYISPHDVYHTPDGHMTQFPVLCDYIEQRESHRKFMDVYRCINLYGIR
jgi:hypothetical protein